MQGSDDRFDATASVTICVFTTDPTDAPSCASPSSHRTETASRHQAAWWSTRSPRSGGRSSERGPDGGTLTTLR
jgi:hypothetical protein